jgi:hypothetical protein
LLHPDKPEHITGADLIYEQHDEENRRLRFSFLQYKIWEKGVIYINEANRVETQLLKMKNKLCDSGFCNGPSDMNSDYRFPYCCAFLRPTDKLIPKNNKLISSGIHIPVCNALNIKTKEGGKIDKKFIREQAITQDVFEHLFNKGFIGSRWLSEKEIAQLYTDSQIIQPYESIIIYAREIRQAKAG